jgi:two-component system CheB/CheR fusion protein
MTPYGSSGAIHAPDIGLAAHALRTAETPEEIVTVIRASARRKGDVDGVTFVVREGDNCTYVAEDANGPLWTGSTFPLSMCITGHCILSTRTIVVPDIYLDPRIPHEAYRPTFVKSLLVVPIGRPQAIAAVGFYWARTGAVDAPTVTFLEALAAAASESLTACAARTIPR